MARVALHPRLTPDQNRSRPSPYGDTTPIPLMTTLLIHCTDHTPSLRYPWLMALRRMAALGLAWCALAAAPSTTAHVPEAAARAFEQVSEDTLRQYVDRLASDELRGRGIGDSGNRAAEEFICTTLQQGGVTPAAADGTCYQTVIITRTIPDVRTPLTIHNVLGIIEGRDPTHRDEMVVVGAHLDRDGTDRPRRFSNVAHHNAHGPPPVTP